MRKWLHNFQFVSWFPDWHGFAFIRTDPNKTDLALIFDWFFFFGFWEIRRWKDDMRPG